MTAEKKQNNPVAIVSHYASGAIFIKGKLDGMLKEGDKLYLEDPAAQGAPKVGGASAELREKFEELARDLYNSEKGRHFAARLEKLVAELADVETAPAPREEKPAAVEHRFYDQQQVSDAWVCVRKNNQTIPSEALDDMRSVLIAALESGKAPTNPVVQALRPFADLAELYDEDKRSTKMPRFGTFYSWQPQDRGCEVTVEHLRAARAAIREYDAATEGDSSAAGGLSLPTRDAILLRATYDLLNKQATAGYVLNILDEEVLYDDASCDGRCLMNDIAIHLDLDVDKTY